MDIQNTGNENMYHSSVFDFNDENHKHTNILLSKLIKINAFNKNLITKINVSNNENKEFSIEKFTNKNYLLESQNKLIDVISSVNYYDINPRKFDMTISTSNENELFNKSIIEVKQNYDNTKILDDLKKNFSESFFKLENKHEKLEQTQQALNNKIIENKKEIIEKFESSIKNKQETLVNQINDNTKKQLEEFKRNLLRS